MRKWGKEVWDFARRKSVRKEGKAMFITETVGADRVKMRGCCE